MLAFRRWFADQRFWIAFAINWVGALLYVLVASQFWADPALKDIPGAGSGDPLIWGLTALPIMVAFLLANIGWALFALTKLIVKRRMTINPAYLLIPIIWGTAIYVDYWHHWR